MCIELQVQSAEDHIHPANAVKDLCYNAQAWAYGVRLHPLPTGTSMITIRHIPRKSADLMILIPQSRHHGSIRQHPASVRRYTSRRNSPLQQVNTPRFCNFILPVFLIIHPPHPRILPMTPQNASTQSSTPCSLTSNPPLYKTTSHLLAPLHHTTPSQPPP